MAPGMTNTKDLSPEGLHRLAEVYEEIESASMTVRRLFSVASSVPDVLTSDTWSPPPTLSRFSAATELHLMPLSLLSRCHDSRHTGFDWPKPDRPGPGRLAELAAVERARHLKVALLERERHIRVLRRHLVEANRHRVHLGDALQRFEGQPTWAELNRENADLREQLVCVSRDNAVLAGQQRNGARVASSLRHQRRHRLAP